MLEKIIRVERAVVVPSHGGLGPCKIANPARVVGSAKRKCRSSRMFCIQHLHPMSQRSERASPRISLAWNATHAVAFATFIQVTTDLCTHPDMLRGDMAYLSFGCTRGARLELAILALVDPRVRS